MDQWYVSRGKATKGPFTSAQLQALARKGQLRATDLLSRQDSAKWVAAGKFRELFPAEAEPASAAPPPVERSAAPPVEPPPLPVPVPRKTSKALWPGVAGAAAGICLLVIVSVVFVVGRSGSDPTGAGEPIAGTTKPSAPPSPKPGVGDAPGQELGDVPRPQDDARRDYHELARILSQDYLLNGAEVAEEPNRPHLQRLSRSAHEKGMQFAAAILLKDMEIFDERKLAAEIDDQERMRQGEALLERADRGELTRMVTYVDTDGRQHEYEVEDIWAVMWAHSLASGSAPKDPVVEALKRRITLDSSRARAWDELLPALPEKFAGPLTGQPLVTIEFLADGPNGERLSKDRWQDLVPYRSPFAGRYVARNVAGRDLHNVTLAVEMHHYSTLPDATLRHVYYVPVWKQDALLEFSRNFVAVPKRGGKRYTVPLDPMTGASNWSGAAELQMMAGIVRMQATVWADEARQAPATVEISERARIVVSRLVQLAEDHLSSEIFPSISKRAHRSTLDQLLRPVLALLSADDASARHAQRMLDDFEGARAELLRKKEANLLAACAEGQRYLGHWAAAGRGGGLGLLFISCDASGTRIRAEVFDPRKPDQRRLLAGSICRELPLKNTLLLKPLFPDQGGETTILSSSIKSYCFKFQGGMLVGEASRFDQGGYDGEQKPITLNPSPGDARELMEAKKRNEAVP